MKRFTLILVLVLTVPAAALADDECSVDSDCPYGFQCEEVPMPCTAIPDCPPCACACPVDADCEPCQCEPCPEPKPCEATTAKLCTYDPVECSGDGDCDDGFECIEVESCSGSGCACPACACATCPAGVDCPPCDCPEVIECDCNPEDFKEECKVEGAWCMPGEKACDGDSDCPDGWECKEVPVPCGCAPCLCPDIACAPDSVCPEVQECDCPPCQCDDSGEKSCLPEGWSEAGYGGSESSPDSAFASLGGSKNDGTQNPEPSVPGAPEDSIQTKSGTCAAGKAPSSGLLPALAAGLLGLCMRRGRETPPNSRPSSIRES